MPKTKSRRPHGHSSDTSLHDGLAVHREHAASDDVTGPFVAMVAASPAAAGANRDAYAEAASASAQGEDGASPRAAGRHRASSESNSKLNDKSNGASKSEPDSPSKNDSNRLKNIPPATEALPPDGPEFVEAVHARMDLIALQVELLRSGDEKIVQRELDCLRELRYGKTTSSATSDGAAQPFDLRGFTGGSNKTQ